MDIDKKSVNMDDIIIEKPQGIRKFRFFSEMSLAVIGWTVWLFIIRPIFQVLLWFMGFKIFYEEIIKNESLKNVKQLWAYLLVIILLYTILQLWNRYNVIRFRGKERRRSSAPASDKEMGDFYGMTEEDVRNLKKWKMVIVHFCPDHQIVLENAVDSNPTHICGCYDPEKINTLSTSIRWR
jgi:poly-beta-1,6-N-acetyl-D-glucosamine biosynthesis protein PgaD